jgi:hypothetical protein
MNGDLGAGGGGQRRRCDQYEIWADTEAASERPQASLALS